MELDDARALKALLFNRIVEPRKGIVFDTTIGGGFDTSVALGISMDSGGSFRVAVRIQGSVIPSTVQATLSAFNQAELDVRVIGMVRAAVRMGASISNHDRGAGTLACLVRDRASGTHCILSNDHVFGYTSGAPLENAVISPSREDGGRAGQDTVGHFVRGTRLQFDGSTNLVDVAIARLAEGVNVEVPVLPQYRYQANRGAVEPGGRRRVAKIGRTTGLTFGTVSALDIDALNVDFRLGQARFDDQFEITGVSGKFADEGDSGALVVDVVNGAAVGILFAVNDRGIGYANRLAPALAAMGVGLA